MNDYVNAGALEGPEGANNEMQGDNPWAMLLRTVLPWVNVGQAPDYSQQEDPSGQSFIANPEDQQPADQEADDEEDDLD